MVGWADDCRDAGGRAMQEQLPKKEAQQKASINRYFLRTLY